MPDAIGYAAEGPYSRLKPVRLQRPDPGEGEVAIDVLFCGVCHSDIHQVRNEWKNTVYPCMPGHEIVGRVTATGSGVQRHAVGDLVGVGCMVDSCRQCGPCQAGEQNYCEGPNSWLATYNGPMKPAAQNDGVNTYGRDNTFGGYSSSVVVREDFVLQIPPGLDPASAAPLLCAGVTTYSPLKHFGVKVGSRVGVLGFGGLGHIACQLAKAMGAEVFVFTRTPAKFEQAQKMGIAPILENDETKLKGLAGTFDFILSTVPQKHDINPFIPLLKRDCVLCVVGALEPMVGVNNMALAFHRQRVAGSLIGSIAETQEVLDFCAQHQITALIERIGGEDLRDAYKMVEAGKVQFRYVLDIDSLHALDASELPWLAQSD
jgi:uncharacterized zinc-type alcohol dehydrogenase-like protein